MLEALETVDYFCTMWLQDQAKLLGHPEKEISEVLLYVNELQSENIPCPTGRMMEGQCLVPKKYLKW